MSLPEILITLGPEAQEIEDSGEETFLLFSQSLPSNDLGFVDAKATTLDLTVAGRELTIHQSPALLSSKRHLGTTGAVLWQVTPIFAEWMASDGNILFNSILDRSSVVLELGCGSSGVLALSISPKVSHYIATDQSYVEKLLRKNLDENEIKPKRQKGTHGKSKMDFPASSSNTNIEFVTLDWETSVVSGLLNNSSSQDGFDLLLALDCIYNEALIDPFVRTCAEICRLKPNKTVAIIAQQLRSDIVFEAWLSAFHKEFRVWRVPDHLLTETLRGNSGFVIHLGLVRET